MNAQEVINKLTWEEVTSHDDLQRARVLRDERMKLQVAVNRRPTRPEHIAAQMREAVRVAQMWGVEFPARCQ
jgi:hypothetical protein